MRETTLHYSKSSSSKRSISKSATTNSTNYYKLHLALTYVNSNINQSLYTDTYNPVTRAFLPTRMIVFVT